jgi:flagellin
MIEVLGNVLSGISNARANVSAIHSRLEFSRDYAQTLVDNVSEAYSRTMDTDLALEVADLVKNQILQQAEIAALTQANLQAQLVLKLLEPLSKNS